MTDDKPTYTYQVRTSEGMETIQAKIMRAVSGCLALGDGTGWIRLFAPGAWVTAVRVETQSNANPPKVQIGMKLPGMPEGGD
jgi:hypothetical protein